jgi:hypothetical protein
MGGCEKGQGGSGDAGGQEAEEVGTDLFPRVVARTSRPDSAERALPQRPNCPD